jgi:hypothetical protein
MICAPSDVIERMAKGSEITLRSSTKWRIFRGLQVVGDELQRLLDVLRIGKRADDKARGSAAPVDLVRDVAADLRVVVGIGEPFLEHDLDARATFGAATSAAPAGWWRPGWGQGPCGPRRNQHRAAIGP